MANRHNTLTDEVFKNSKYIDMIQRHYGIKNFRKEYSSQYKILLDIFQTFILVSNCFNSDSNLSLADKTDNARTIIEKLIYNDYENSQKHKYSVRDIKDLLDKRARRLYNSMSEWQKVFATITTRNATTSIELKQIIETINKEMQELEFVEFDSVVSDNLTFKKNNSKYYKEYKKYICKFDPIYNKREDFIKEFKENYYKHNGITLTEDDITNFAYIFNLVSNGNNGFINVINEVAIDTTSLGDNATHEDIYKVYLQQNGMNYDSEDFKANAFAFNVVLEALYKKVNAKMPLSFMEVLSGYDIFSFLVICEETILQDNLKFSFVANDMNKIIADLKEAYKTLMQTQMTEEEIKEDNKRYYQETLIPAYNIIKDIIDRYKDYFMEVS